MPVWRAFIAAVLSIHCAAAAAAAVEIHSISPHEITAGSELTVKGTGFSPETIAVLGDKAIRPFSVQAGQIRLVLPADLAPGIYTFQLKDGGGRTPTLGIVVKKKEVTVRAFTPEAVDLCSVERNITVTGTNLNEIRRISVNGVNVRDMHTGRERCVFTVPEDALAQMQQSVTVYFYNEKQQILDLLSLRLNMRPTVEKAEMTGSAMTYQEFRVTGRNFIKGITLFVNGQPIMEKDSPAGPRERSSGRRATAPSPLLDRFERLSCTEIVYMRHPVSSEPAQLEFAVENPTGEKSNTVIIAAP